MKAPRHIFLPLIFALVFVLGIFIGAKLNFSQKDRPLFFFSNQGSTGKLNEVINYIEEQYVDTITKNQIIDQTLSAMLESLDPHSAYIPASDFKAANEPLQGNFEGIGIEFNIIHDTIRVISVVPDGPSEQAGLKAGDKIVKVNGKEITGPKISNEEVFNRIRGIIGSVVTITVERRGEKSQLAYNVTRGKIPIHSIEVFYMVNKNTGYIKINRFAATTYDEYLLAFDTLTKQGMQQMILDLRGNPGGYLTAAISLSDEFLAKGLPIVYTKGRSRPKKEYRASEKGKFEKGNLVVLVDEGSASASEILAGALQDNDRAIIVGRRSFGKGLVQEQIDFSDSSALRLTIARYYTPTGRSIQKSYDNGNDLYYKEQHERFAKGELQHADSIKFTDTLKYRTPKGRILYGGGGIMPDEFVALDTNKNSNYLTTLFAEGIIHQFAFEYADNAREKLNQYKDFKKFNVRFVVDNKILGDLIRYAEKAKLEPVHDQIKRSEDLIRIRLKALIARYIWGDSEYYQVLHSIDYTLDKGKEVINTPL